MKGELEARLTLLAYWTLRLLANKTVELGLSARRTGNACAPGL